MRTRFKPGDDGTAVLVRRSAHGSARVSIRDLPYGTPAVHARDIAVGDDNGGAGALDGRGVTALSRSAAGFESAGKGRVARAKPAGETGR